MTIVATNRMRRMAAAREEAYDAYAVNDADRVLSCCLVSRVSACVAGRLEEAVGSIVAADRSSHTARAMTTGEDLRMAVTTGEADAMMFGSFHLVLSAEDA